jgi:hypothetical protein
VRSKFQWAMLCIALLATAGLASATPVTVSCSVVSGPTELNDNIVCPQFNPVTGVLNSISIVVSGTISGSITLTNNAATSQTVNGTATSQFFIDPLAGFVFVNPIFSAAYSTGAQTLTAGQTSTFSGLAGNGSANLGPNTSNFVPYEGVGSFNIPVSTLSGISIVGGGGQIGSDQSTNGTATAQVTYVFDETGNVPEPGTILLMGAGLVLLGLAPKHLRR